MTNHGFKSTVLKFNQYKKISKFRTEFSLILKLHEIHKKYGLKLTYKIKHGELFYNNVCLYRAGCIANLSQVINNSYDLYNDSHNRLFTKIEELSPNIIKVSAVSRGRKKIT